MCPQHHGEDERKWKKKYINLYSARYLDMEQLGVLVLNIVTETSFHASVQVSQALLEVRLEPAGIQHVSNVPLDNGDH